MKINHDCKNNQLSDTLSTFLKKNINLAHIKLISLFVVALCKAKTVCFSLLSTVFDSPAKSSSCLRRIQRFSLNSTLTETHRARHLPPAAHKGPFCLTIDSTNWQFDSTDINIFMLAVVHDGVAYPLLFSILPKKGTSNTKERIELVQRYVRLFGAESIDCLLADREFVGEHWVKWLNDCGILKHGRKAKSIFRYGLDIVTEFLLRGRNEYKIPIFDFSAIVNQILTPD